jgi:hypothetical protein
MKRVVSLVASVVASLGAIGACASGPHRPKGPPPEYEEAPATSATTPSASSSGRTTPLASDRPTVDAATD